MAASAMSQRMPPWRVPIGFPWRASAFSSIIARPGSTEVSRNPISLATAGGGASPRTSCSNFSIILVMISLAVASDDRTFYISASMHSISILVLTLQNILVLVVVGGRRAKRFPNKQRNVIHPPPAPIANAVGENAVQTVQLRWSKRNCIVTEVDWLQLALQDVGGQRAPCYL